MSGILKCCLLNFYFFSLNLCAPKYQQCLTVEQLHAGFNELEQNVLPSRLLMLKSSKKWQDVLI